MGSHLVPSYITLLSRKESDMNTLENILNTFIFSTLESPLDYDVHVPVCKKIMKNLPMYKNFAMHL